MQILLLNFLQVFFFDANFLQVNEAVGWMLRKRAYIWRCPVYFCNSILVYLCLLSIGRPWLIKCGLMIKHICIACTMHDSLLQKKSIYLWRRPLSIIYTAHLAYPSVRFSTENKLNSVVCRMHQSTNGIVSITGDWDQDFGG